jgi:hypothetical protein
MNAARPLMRCGVAELKAMVALYKTDLNMLAQLEQELMHRQVPRAVELLAKVRAIIASDGGSAVATQSQRTLQSFTPQGSLDLGPSLLSEPLDASEVKRVSSGTEAAAKPVATKPFEPNKPASNLSPQAAKGAHKPKVTPIEDKPVLMTLSEAYKTLQANPGSSWESIEMLRRQLVQPSHPRRLEKVPKAQIEQVIQEARRVNAAYAIVANARCGLN